MLIQKLAAFLREARAQVAITFGIAMPLMLTFLTGGVDYARWLSQKSDVQNAADTAALAGAKEMRLAHAVTSTISAVARQRAFAALGSMGPDAVINVSIQSINMVQVQIDVASTSLFGALAPAALSHIHAQATAQTASTPTCLIALGNKGPGLTLKTAAINANGCAAYTDSIDKNALALNAATISAAQTCSAGGVNLQLGYASPAAITDCPNLADPLASRPSPPVGSCLSLGNKTGQPYVVSGGSQTLYPGNYCYGLFITNQANVSLSPGVYVMSGGPLKVDKNSTLQGNEVGFYFTGKNAVLNLDVQSTINFVAPSDGPMAGILMFEDRLAKLGNKHKLGSRSAPQLLGTIYLPQGNLTIGAPVAGPYESQLVLDITTCSLLGQSYPCSPTALLGQQSAWTIVIANQITVNFIINLQLNTNYSATTTAPPAEMSFKGASLTQ